SEGLAALVRRTPGVAAWNGPYLKGGNVPNDPWNNPYLYRAPGEHGPFDIVSLGSDGQEGGSGTAADISLDTMNTMTSARNEGEQAGCGCLGVPSTALRCWRWCA